MLPLLFFSLAVLPFGAEGGQIIGGVEAKEHSRPYMAFLILYENNSLRGYCDGFLVREDFVMTAAHCYTSQIMVILGAHNIKKNENTQQVIPVLKSIRHKENSTAPFVNDIMLLKLKHKAEINDAVQTISLPKKNDWEVNLEIQNDHKCHEIFPNYHKSTQMCVGNPKFKKTAGSGDSGGPLVCNNVAQGILSYSNFTGEPPQVYIRISSFIPWIKKEMKLLKHP